MPKFVYIGTPKVHSTPTLETQKKQLLSAITAAERGKTPPVTADKHQLLRDINAELARRP